MGLGDSSAEISPIYNPFLAWANLRHRRRYRCPYRSETRVRIYDTKAESAASPLPNDASGKIRAVGRLISKGSRAAFFDATLFNEKGQLCATATSTPLVFELGLA